MVRRDNRPVRNISIREFPLHKMRPDSRVAVIGKSGAGKSTIIDAIHSTWAHFFPVVQVQSGTEDVNRHAEQHNPKLFIYNDFNIQAVQNFVQRQIIAIKEGVKNPYGMLTLEDCTDEPKDLDKKVIRGIMKKGRQWLMMFIISLQYSMDIKPWMRSNLDYIFIAREPILSNREKIWRNFASVFSDFRDFCDAMDQLTDDYTVMVLNNRTSSNNLEDLVFYYRANIDAVRKYTMGAPEIWEWNDTRYNPDYTEPIIVA